MREVKKPMSQEEQWKALMNEPDPLQETDIYANEKTQEEEAQKGPSPDELEMEEDIGNVLDRSFKSEKNKSTLVQNIPAILQKKKDANYAKLFIGISENDVNTLDV